MTKRRDFIKKSVLGTAGIAIGGMGFRSKSYASIIGANERINVAVIGLRGQGRNHISSFCTIKDTRNVQLKTICDADEQFFAERAKTVFDRIGVKPTTEWNMRKIFDDKEIHAVSFATPNFWHALGTIWACQAGKHVYVEKPGHYNWHWFWDTGNGDTGNQGPHQFDIARWGLNKNEHPVSAYAAGGVYGIDPKECAQETPNTLSCTFKYKDGKMLEFETRGRYFNGESGLNVQVGDIFYGTEGYLELNRQTWRAFRKNEKEPFAGSDIGERKQTTSRDSDHFANFIDAICSGKKKDLNCDINDGYYSSVLPHLANISYRLERGLKFNGEIEKFVNDPEADEILRRKDYRKPYVIPDKV